MKTCVDFFVLLFHEMNNIETFCKIITYLSKYKPLISEEYVFSFEFITYYHIIELGIDKYFTAE